MSRFKHTNPINCECGKIFSGWKKLQIRNSGTQWVKIEAQLSTLNQNDSLPLWPIKVIKNYFKKEKEKEKRAQIEGQGFPVFNSFDSLRF